MWKVQKYGDCLNFDSIAPDRYKIDTIKKCYTVPTSDGSNNRNRNRG